jgi:hypothetical protein
LPQPSDRPPRLPSDGQFGVQQAPMYVTAPFAHGQVPLQPSFWPASLPSAGQVGVQTQVPPTQRPLVPQPLPPQLQVSMQTPLLQVKPASQTTPAHGLWTQVPATQLWPLLQ